MGNDGKFKGYLIILLILVALSAGMFTVQNFVLGNEPVEYISVYRAREDIPAFSRIDQSMFYEYSVPADVQLDGLITQDNAGRYFGRMFAKSTIFQNEYLSTSSLIDNNVEEGLIYSMQIEPTYVADVAYNDLVDIYTIDPNGEVEQLFSNKKLYKAKTEVSASAAKYEEAVKLYIKVTRAEMFKYYRLLRTHLFIVLPVQEGYTGIDPLDLGFGEN